MKRFLLVFVCLLTGCNIVVESNPIPTPSLRILEASYSTNFSLSNGQPVICDNKTTQLVYRFRYVGELESWTSYLKGRELNQIIGPETFTPGSAGVSPYETAGYEVTYNLPPNTAPYAAQPEAGTVSPQAIIVTPVPNPTPIGATQLYLTLKGANSNAQGYDYRSGDIPVLINCP